MSEFTIQQKLRAAHVKRWHIVNTYREQNVAEHSFLVSVLAVEISRKIGHSNYNGGPINMEKDFQIMRWAMWHDLPEVVLGDIPTPTKTTLKVLAGFEVAERAHHLVSNQYSTIKDETYPTVKAIVKLADLLEARLFLQEEGKGNHSREVYHGVLRQIDEHLKLCKKIAPTFRWNEIAHLMYRS